MKILFVLKERFYSNINVKSYGLINSSKELAKYLEFIGNETKVVTVIDGNGIDREVFLYKPDMVIIEALWVTAPKLKELMEIRRYKKITWVIRIHSNAGFLSSETFALKYINDYIALEKENLIIGPNNKEFTEYLSNSLKYKFEYLPNVVEQYDNDNHSDENNVINIGCFGALRILKNHLFQAMCAMKAADILDKTLRFHITVDVNINKDQLNPVLRNLEELFKGSKHELIQHPWNENDDFHQLIKRMDLGMQLSYTESFNIVSSDFINYGIPIIISNAIKWMPDNLKTSTTNFDVATQKIVDIYKKRNSRSLLREMRRALEKYDRGSQEIWWRFIEKLEHHHHHDY
jgi:hypothetical protein